MTQTLTNQLKLKAAFNHFSGAKVSTNGDIKVRDKPNGLYRDLTPEEAKVIETQVIAMGKKIESDEKKKRFEDKKSKS